MSVFSEEVHDLLTEAGWYAGRAVSTDLYQQETAGLQLPWLPAAAAFLSEFGGLHCYFARQDLGVARMQFEVQQAATVLCLDRLRTEYTPRVPGRALSIVGQAYTDPLCLLVAADGSFYGACDEGLYYIGATADEALSAIVLDLPFQDA
ncbi:SUKH-3 domain-containing protein [Hymenobacter psychrotolerans]|uniref:SUKH-3 immunity protein n=1 Tax=Hymenobacter psychrotolerans DSM 18569 TaxID=1121959 RepID=A0A1M7CES1_9BACT|nr:SUKH-3 domain-containing protein [Hymenobacter psychrotolerans]SHL65389.1 SUKH-3 immunity protein [Hymenobacter psychrotolerans DSM 18569]